MLFRRNHVEVARGGDVLTAYRPSRGLKLMLVAFIIISYIFICDVQHLLLACLNCAQVLFHVLSKGTLLVKAWGLLDQIRRCMDIVKVLILLHIVLDHCVHSHNSLVVFIEQFVWINIHLQSAQPFKSAP